MDPEAVRVPAVVLLLAACARKEPPREEPKPAPEPAVTVPPVAQAAEPVTAFLDAGAIESPYEQARTSFANGQVWLARLVLEKKALGSDGTPAELELLARICEHQADKACARECARKLGARAPAPTRKKGK